MIGRRDPYSRSTDRDRATLDSGDRDHDAEIEAVTMSAAERDPPGGRGGFRQHLDVQLGETPSCVCNCGSLVVSVAPFGGRKSVWQIFDKAQDRIY